MENKSAQNGVHVSSNSVKLGKKKRSGCGASLTVVIILLIAVFCCLVGVSASLATGKLQQEVCNIVRTNDSLASRLNCNVGVIQNNSSDSANNYPINVSDSGAPAASYNGLDVAGIYENASKSVVGVGIKDTGASTGTANTDEVIGTGFVVSANGLIATNQHVVSNTSAEYFVKFLGSDELITVTKIYRDPSNDIAILVINKTGLPALTLGNSVTLKPGQAVVAIGNPLGSLSSTVTTGIISGLNRTVTVGDTTFNSSVSKFDDAIQTDAAINPGNSGGPLLDSAGKVIGINFARVQGADNLSFALPVGYLRSRLTEIQQYGKFKIPFLGIEYRSRLVAVGGEVYTGAQIQSIQASSPASSVLKVGDIIISFGGKDLEENSLLNLIQRSQIGEVVEVGIIRQDGTKASVKVTVGERQ